MESPLAQIAGLMWEVFVIAGHANPCPQHPCTSHNLGQKMADTKIANWAETIKFHIPEDRYFTPTSMDDLISAMGSVLTDGQPNGLKLRFKNSGHAWSPGIVPGEKPYQLPKKGDPVPDPDIEEGVLIDVTGLCPENKANDSYFDAKVISDTSGNAYACIPSGMTQGSYTEKKQVHVPNPNPK